MTTRAQSDDDADVIIVNTWHPFALHKFPFLISQFMKMVATPLPSDGISIKTHIKLTDNAHLPGDPARVYTILSFSPLYLIKENRKRVTKDPPLFPNQQTKTEKLKYDPLYLISFYSFCKIKKWIQKSIMCCIYRPFVFRFRFHNWKQKKSA